MLENPKEMNTTTKPETASVTVKKVHLFACFFSTVYGIFNCIPKTERRQVKWIISIQACSRKRVARFADIQNLFRNFTSMPRRAEKQGSQIFVSLVTKPASMRGMWNGITEELQSKSRGTMNTQESIAVKTPSVPKSEQSIFTQSIVRETGSWCTPNTVASVLAVAKRRFNFLPLITSIMTGISKGRKGFTLMVRNSTAGLFKTTSRKITEFFVTIVILEERETAVSVLIRKVQRLSRKGVHSSEWKRPLPLIRAMI
jgi:hypothetical protein